MLDGYPVNIKDVVYVLGVGSGTVTSITADGGFTVRTGNGEAFYRDGGYVGNQKRVFWSDPMIVTPPKDRRFWRAYVRMAQLLFKEGKEFYKYGDEIVDTEKE